MDNNAYLLRCTQTAELALIDAARASGLGGPLDGRVARPPRASASVSDTSLVGVEVPALPQLRQRRAGDTTRLPFARAPEGLRRHDRGSCGVRFHAAMSKTPEGRRLPAQRGL